MRRAPAVTEAMAKALRAARDGGWVIREAMAPMTFRACGRHRWLAPRLLGRYVITDGGLAALAHYDADVAMEKLWRGAPGDL